MRTASEFHFDRPAELRVSTDLLARRAENECIEAGSVGQSPPEPRAILEEGEIAGVPGNRPDPLDIGGDRRRAEGAADGARQGEVDTVSHPAGPCGGDLDQVGAR